MAGPNLSVPKGISAQAVRTIPTDWDSQWFKRFITDHMQKADYRNATAGAGITITGTEQGGGTISAGGTLTSPVVIPAPATAATTLTVSGLNGSITAAFGSAGSSVITNTSVNGYPTYYQATTSTFATASFGVNATSSTDVNGIPAYSFGIGSASDLPIAIGSYGVPRIIISAAGAIAINAPSAGTTLGVIGAAGAFAVGINASTTTGNSYGLAIHGGTNSTDVALTVGNAAITATYFVIKGDGGVTFNSNGTQAGFNFNAVQGASSATAGGASALPSAPAAYWALQVNSSNYKIPLYNN